MTMTTMTATVIAGSANEAIAKVAKHIIQNDLPGFGVTGHAAVRDAQKNLYSVEVLNAGGDVNDAWVTLTSYGIDLDGSGSAWETTEGL